MITGDGFGAGHTFTRNVAFDNAETIDIVDTTPDCGANRYRRNEFGSASSDCIK